MVLEIKRLISKGEYKGEVSFDYQPEKDAMLLPLCGVDGNVMVTASYEIFEEDEVEVTIKLSYRLKGQCSYCLEDAVQDIEYSTDVLFVTDSGDTDNYVYDGYKLDLTAAVNDAFLISQPKVLLCGDDCKGIEIK